MSLRRAPDGYWMTYRSNPANGWGPKQCALLDAISSLSALTESDPPDASTTAELAGLVGCSIDEAWHALVLTEYAIPEWPAGVERPILADALEIEAQHRHIVLWWLPETDADDDDETWYSLRVEEAVRLGLHQDDHREDDRPARTRPHVSPHSRVVSRRPGEDRGQPTTP